MNEQIKKQIENIDKEIKKLLSKKNTLLSQYQYFDYPSSMSGGTKK